MRWTLPFLIACSTPDDPPSKDDSDLVVGTGDTADTTPPAPSPWSTRPLLTPATDPFQGADITSCARAGDTRCEAGALQRCAPYDVAVEAFAAPPEPVRLAFLRDRQQDLAHTLHSSGLSFTTTSEMAPGTDESVWWSPETFGTWDDHGDAAYYTGYFLYGAALRYAHTGTVADHARMADLVDRQLLNWEITGAPGYMFRAPFAMLPQGTPVPPGHPELPLHDFKERTNHVVYTLDDDALAALGPDFDGTLDLDGTPTEVTGTAEGSPSLDAFSGAILGLVHAHDLLDDTGEDAVRKQEIADQVVCHLHRYKKLRIRNLQAKATVRDAIAQLLGSGAYTVEEGELDVSSQDTLYGYVMEAKPADGAPLGSWITGCPDELPREVDPAYDLDAGSNSFLFELLDLVNRLQGQGNRPIDYVYFTNLRAGDAVFMLDLAVQAWHLTGDERYLTFIEEDLIGEQALLDVLPTIDHFDLPDFCDSWIGSDLVHPIVRMIADRLENPQEPVVVALREAMREGYREDVLANQGNRFFDITYAAYADRGADPSIDADVDAARTDLEGYIPEPEHPDDPKRATNRDWLDSGLPWVDPREPTEAERAICTEPQTLLGIEVPAPGLIDDILNATPVPAGYRTKETQLWHFAPFRLRRTFGGHLRTHEPFNDYTTPMWRLIVDTNPYGRWALGWKGTAEACSP